MKKKFMVNSLSLMVILAIYLLLTTYHLSSTINSTYATDSTSSASPSANLVEKINALKSEIASKAAQLKLDTSKQIQNKAYLGIVQQIENNQLSLATKTGNKIISFNDFTIFQSKSRKPSVKDFLKDDYAVALGDVDDKGNLVAKKIVKVLNPFDSKKELFWGQIQDVSAGVVTVMTKDKQTLDIYPSSKTDIFEGNDEANLSDLKVNRFIVASGIKNKDGAVKAQFIYLIPFR